MRSRALSEMIKSKHTVELKNLAHEQSTDIIAVLMETHTRGRYSLPSDFNSRFSTDPTRSVKKIDIYFTNGAGENLDGEYNSSQPSNTPVNGNDTEIEAIGSDLLAWIDYDNSRVFDAAYQQSTGAGSDAQYIYNRGPNSLLIFANQYGSALQLANFGNTLALHQTGSWQSSADSTPVDYTSLNDVFSLHFMFSMSAINDFCYLFDLYMMRVIMYSGSLQYYDAAGARQVVPGITIIPLQNYLISVQRETDGSGGFEFDWRVERLSDNSIQTATTGSGLTFPSQIARTWRMGAANTSFTQYQGPFIVHNGVDTTHISTSQAWLRNKFDGVSTTTSTSETEETTNSANLTEHATFFAQLEVRTV